jgi:hypothetical protein
LHEGDSLRLGGSNEVSNSARIDVALAVPIGSDLPQAAGKMLRLVDSVAAAGRVG